MSTTASGDHGPAEAAPFTGLSHVQLLVTDVAASAAWYRAALGLEAYVEDLSVGYVALRHRPSKMVIVLTTGAGDRGPGPLDHLAFAVADGAALKAWADHLATIGIDHQGVVSEDGRPSLALHDPDGTAIELVAPAPRPPRTGR
jgi:catechol 2,3-dioxygenase-like lactoylglutathione lyase family enzyme